MKNSLNNQKQTEPMPKYTRIVVLIASFLGAFLLWIYAIGYDSSLFEETYNGVEVTITGEDALKANSGFTLAADQDFSSITITAKGKRAALNALEAKDFQAVVDVSKAQSAGWQTLDITVISPNGVEVVSQSSGTVRVFVDEFTQKNDLLTVEIDTGDKGYRLGEGVSRINFSVNPAVVTVSGPKSVLDSVARAVVKFPLDGNEIKEDVRGYGAITLFDKDGNTLNNQYLALSDSTAEVALTVIKEKVLPVRVALAGGALIEGITVETPVPGAITVSGSSAAISALGGELVLTIDETTLLPGKTHILEFPIVEMLPKNISTENSGNITVKITVPKLSVREYSISADRIEVENLPENYVCNIEKGIKVRVAGPLSAFEGFDSQTITAKIDFNNVTFTEAVAAADINLFAKEKVNTNGSYKANVTVELQGGDTPLYLINEPHEVSFTVSAVPEAVS